MRGRFRPFVYGLALRHGLAGYVLNDASGVTIGAEGSAEQLAAFALELRELAPPLAASIISAAGTARIRIPTSMANFMASFELKRASSRAPPRSPSRRIRGMCEACARDVANPADRHHRYPFTNCTHCGPRYTIIRRLPTTDPTPPWPTLPCARAALRPMKTRWTDATTPSR